MAGAYNVHVRAEFSTAGDDRVCSVCAGLEGEIYTLDEAADLIPVHPNCRCITLPVNDPTAQTIAQKELDLGSNLSGPEFKDLVTPATQKMKKVLTAKQKAAFPVPAAGEDVLNAYYIVGNKSDEITALVQKAKLVGKKLGKSSIEYTEIKDAVVLLQKEKVKLNYNLQKAYNAKFKEKLALIADDKLTMAQVDAILSEIQMPTSYSQLIQGVKKAAQKKIDKLNKIAVKAVKPAPVKIAPPKPVSMTPPKIVKAAPKAPKAAPKGLLKDYPDPAEKC